MKAEPQYEVLPVIVDECGEVQLAASFTSKNGIRIGLLDTESDDPNWREFDFTDEQARMIGEALIRWTSPPEVSGSMQSSLPSELRMAAIFRADLPLSPGKLAAQAGHAFLTVWREAADKFPERIHSYDDFGQTKLVLLAPDLATLTRIYAKARERNIPAALISDAGRTELEAGTVTVLGLGPMSKTDSNALTRGLSLL